MPIMSETELPTDLMWATDAAEELGIDYLILRYWWQTKKIRSWTRGRRRLISRAEVVQYQTDSKIIRPSE